MKRDMDYIRQLLLDIEAAPAAEPWSNRSSEKVGGAELYEHLRLLEEAGFIRVGHHSVLHGGHEIWHGVTLTWPGNDFLNTVRADTVWNKTKESLSKVGGTASIQIIAELATSVAKGLMRLT